MLRFTSSKCTRTEFFPRISYNQYIGRYDVKQLESVLKKYIKDYVTYINCNCPKTILSRNTITRLFLLTYEE